jgi:ribonuclease HI
MNTENISCLHIYTDGASRGNPGPAGAGIYVADSSYNVLLKKSFFLDKKTNNQAEYIAVALAVYLILPHIKDKNLELKFSSDSQLLVMQMNGMYKVKNKNILQIKTVINSMLDSLNYSFEHVLREKNKIADSLANIGINRKAALSTDISNFFKTLLL